MLDMFLQIPTKLSTHSEICPTPVSVHVGREDDFGVSPAPAAALFCAPFTAHAQRPRYFGMVSFLPSMF